VAVKGFHTGSVCTSGLACLGPQNLLGVGNVPTPLDRRHLDFFETAVDPAGRLFIAHPADRDLGEKYNGDFILSWTDLLVARQTGGPTIGPARATATVKRTPPAKPNRAGTACDEGKPLRPGEGLGDKNHCHTGSGGGKAETPTVPLVPQGAEQLQPGTSAPAATAAALATQRSATHSSHAQRLLVLVAAAALALTALGVTRMPVAVLLRRRRAQR
jgi:hypothetical protein